ncbi:glycosyltransferase [Candidatus Parcubacteria bacterium]|nr:MAG: glycosyltransferase [Candidatus Parcubacteria bacterium]
MNIAYVANIRLPTERAHGYQIMRVCSELAALGHTVTLYVPKRRNHIGNDSFEYYGIEKNFSIVFISTLDLIPFSSFLGPVAFWLSEYFFARALSIPKDSIIYTRDHHTLSYLVGRGYQCFYNAHNWESHRKRYIQRARGVICNSTGTEKAIREAIALPTVVVANATDPNPYIGTDKDMLREELKLPKRPIALYAGHLYAWKGVETIYEAARIASHFSFVFLGGTESDIRTAKEKTRDIHNVSFLGHRKKSEVPKFLVAADVLLLTATIRSGESLWYTSPIKLFEYMASDTPIVASDVPSIREVLSDKTAVLVAPDDAKGLVEGIQIALEKNKSRAHAALDLSRRYTWSAHAAAVSSFFENNVTTRKS